MTTPTIGVPELAGLGSYREAARIGWSVDETVGRLLRYQWLERAVMRTAVARLIATPEWEVKCGLALLQWQSAERVDGLRRRVGEMRHPLPPLDTPPAPALDRFCDELIRAADTIELLAGLYGVAVPRLIAAYHGHLDRANLLVDHPTRRVLRFGLVELEDAVEWGRAALAGLVGADRGAAARAEAWHRHLDAYLAAAGGVSGADPIPAAAPPPTRTTGPFVPDLTPRRDGRFRGQHEFDFPPHVVYNDPAAPADERNLALLAKRTLEMDVPEMMASVMIERTDLPWEFHHDYSRQLWDECRHAMMGTVAFEAKGFDWTTIPLNVGFSLRLNQHATALERQTILFAIEQSLMPGETGKRFELRTAEAAGDPLSAHFHDYDWADEVLHAQIGRRWLKHEGINVEEASHRATGIHQRTWAALDRYRTAPAPGDWWDDLVRRLLGRPTAVPPDRRGDLSILAE